MAYLQYAKQALKKLRQLYAAQINLHPADLPLPEPDGVIGSAAPCEDGYGEEGSSAGRELARICNALCVLDAQEKRILLLCYTVEGFAPEDIMELLHMEKSSFYRKKKAALEKFTRALYGAL